MAGTKPRMTKQHTRAAALPESPASRPEQRAPNAIRTAAPQDLQALFSAPARL